jgi:hypothetical protein
VRLSSLITRAHQLNAWRAACIKRTENLCPAGKEYRRLCMLVNRRKISILCRKNAYVAALGSLPTMVSNVPTSVCLQTFKLPSRAPKLDSGRRNDANRAWDKDQQQQKQEEWHGWITFTSTLPSRVAANYMDALQAVRLGCFTCVTDRSRYIGSPALLRIAWRYGSRGVTDRQGCYGCEHVRWVVAQGDSDRPVGCVGRACCAHQEMNLGITLSLVARHWGSRGRPARYSKPWVSDALPV